MARRFLVLLLGVMLVAPTAGEAGRERVHDLDLIDPVRFSTDDAIVERALITARDGLTALALDIIRPPTEQPVPTIFLQSPYYNTLGRGYRAEHKEPWATPALVPEPTTPFPEWYDEYFVPRGYAVVLQDQRGTRNSSGCQVYGGREEVTDAVDVITWIAEQPWSSGAVGMTGGSYDGTIAIGAASMAPEPLKAIIPIRAIDRWYDYHFFNGVQSAQHFFTPWSFTSATPWRDTQNSGTDDLLLPLHVIERKACTVSIGAAVSAQYSSPYQDATADFWAQRDYLKDAGRIAAATFIIHGLEDTNVKPMNAGHLWDALPRGLPKKLWWFRGGHADPAQPHPSDALPFSFDERFVEATHRWFAQFLKGLDAGALEEPPVSVQAEDGRWWDGRRWPPPREDRTYFLRPHRLKTRAGGARSTRLADLPILAEVSDPLVFESRPMKESTRMAGQSFLRLTYALANGGDSTFAAELAAESPEGARRVIARAYARAAYRDEIARRGPSWPTAPESHVPGEVSVISFPFWHHDVVVPAGWRLELTVHATDDAVAGGGTGGEVTVFLNGQSKLVVPVARPRAAEHERAHR